MSKVYIVSQCLLNFLSNGTISQRPPSEISNIYSRRTGISRSRPIASKMKYPNSFQKSPRAMTGKPPMIQKTITVSPSRQSRTSMVIPCGISSAIVSRGSSRTVPRKEKIVMPTSRRIMHLRTSPFKLRDWLAL